MSRLHARLQRREDEALEYAIARQRDRRSLTKSQISAHIARAVAALDARRVAGRPEKLASAEANSGKSAAAALAPTEGAPPPSPKRQPRVLSPEEVEETYRRGFT
jgi:hypothetical protein